MDLNKLPIESQLEILDSIKKKTQHNYEQAKREQEQTQAEKLLEDLN